MCGRVRLSSDVSEIKLVFSIPPQPPTPNFAPSWNAAPTDQLPIVRSDKRASERSFITALFNSRSGRCHIGNYYELTRPRLASSYAIALPDRS